MRTNPGTIKVLDELTNVEIWYPSYDWAWKLFCRWADLKGVGQDPEDFLPWLECFMSGYALGHEE